MLNWQTQSVHNKHSQQWAQMHGRPYDTDQLIVIQLNTLYMIGIRQTR